MIVGRTVINISNDDAGTLLGKQTSCFFANTLAGAGDDGDLPGEEAAGVVELGGDLLHAFRHVGDWQLLLRQ